MRGAAKTSQLHLGMCGQATPPEDSPGEAKPFPENTEDWAGVRECVCVCGQTAWPEGLRVNRGQARALVLQLVASPLSL